MWCYSTDRCNELASGRHHRLPGIALNSTIQPTTQLSDCYDVDFIVLGLSSQQLVDMQDQINWSAFSKLVILAKGIIEPHMFISDWLADIYEGDLAVLSGPNLALEIAQKKPAATVVASKNNDLALLIQQALSNHYFRVYTSADVRGVECGGIFKNVYAIAAVVWMV